MSASYNSIDFRMIAEEEAGTLKRPLMVPTDFGIQKTKLPYADQEQMQASGRGNLRMTLKCEMYSDSDFVTLLALVGRGAPHALTCEWGEVISDVYLVDMQDIWRVTFSQEIHFTATFERVS